MCLKTGVHAVAAPIEIRSSRVILRGESPGAVVRAAEMLYVLRVGGADAAVTDVTIDSIRFEVTAPGADYGVLWLNDCARVRVAHCDLEVMDPGYSSYIGILADDVQGLTVSGNTLRRMMYGIWIDDYQAPVRIVDNVMTGLTADVFGHSDGSASQYGIWVDSNTPAPCVVEGNTIRHFWVGIQLSRGADASRIADNYISRSEGLVQEPPPTSVDELRQYLDTRLYAIEVEAERCRVSGNRIDLGSSAWGGIRVRGSDASVTGNTLEAGEELGQLLVPAGVYCALDAEHARAADRALVRHNRLLGPQTGIVLSRVAAAVVEGNRVHGDGQGYFGVRVDDCSRACLRDNDIEDVFFAIHLSGGERNRMIGNRVVQAVSGITCVQETAIEVSANAIQSCLVAGIALLGRAGAAVNGNQVTNCGYALLSLGLVVFTEEILVPTGTVVQIEGCNVTDTGIAADGKQVASGAAIGMGGWMPACQISGNRVGYSQADKLDPGSEHRALLLIGPFALSANFGGIRVEYMFGSALVTGNHFRGPGESRLVEFFPVNITDNLDLRFQKVTFNNNVCEHLSAQPSESGATVRLWGGELIAMGNHVSATTNVNSMSLGGRDRVALMGNVTSGDYIRVGTVTPTPIASFNVRT